MMGLVGDPGRILEFTVEDDDAPSALRSFRELAFPHFRRYGYEFEGAGNSWAHWTKDNVVSRAYLFREADQGGVSVLVPGPPALAESLAEVIEAHPAWHPRSSRP